MTAVTFRANLPRLNPGQARPVTPPDGTNQEESMSNLGQGLRRVRVRSLLLIAALAAAVLLPASPAAAGNNQACENRTNNTYRKVLECVTLEGVREHQAAFQAIANANGGNRAAGLPGYTGSVEYVVDKLEAAGWDVTLDEFPFTFLADADAHAADAGQRDLRDGRLHRLRHRHGDRQRDPGGHQPGAAARASRRAAARRPTSPATSAVRLTSR